MKTRFAVALGLPALFLLVGSSGCGENGVSFTFQGVEGNGVLKTEPRLVPAFSRIEVGGVVRLDWRPHPEGSVEATLEENLLPLLVTEVNGDTLKIYFKENVRPLKDVVVKAAGPRLDGLNASGATRSTLVGVKSDRFDLKLNGTSECTIAGQAKALSVECSGAAALKAGALDAGSTTVLTDGTSEAELRTRGPRSVHTAGASKVIVQQVDADDLKIEVCGTSECTITGQAKALSVECSGAAALKGANLNAGSSTVFTEGTSGAELRARGLRSVRSSGASSVKVGGIETESLKIELSGTSHCSLTGQVQTLDLHASGAAELRAPGLKALTVRVDLDGTSSVEMDVNLSLGGSVSGAASVVYLGSPTTVDVKTSGTGSVRRK